jgi:hypothetical protein
MSIGYYALRQVPYIRKWCEGDNWFRPTAAWGYNYRTGVYSHTPGIEEHHCALTCDIIVTGGIAL